MGYFHLVTPIAPMVPDEHLSGVVEQEIEAHGAHLVELAFRGERGGRVVEVFIDSEQGVTTELCAELSRTIGAILDSADGGAYHLVVSSPGADRPLKFPWQYQKHVGRLMSIVVRSDSGSREITGTLTSVDGEGLQVQPKNTQGPARIPFDDVLEGRVQLPW